MSTTPQNKLPGGDINMALEAISPLGQGEAMSSVEEALGLPTIWCKEAGYVPKEERFLFTLVVKPIGKPTYLRDCIVYDVDDLGAEFLFKRLKPKKRVVYQWTSLQAAARLFEEYERNSKPYFWTDGHDAIQNVLLALRKLKSACSKP